MVKEQEPNGVVIEVGRVLVLFKRSRQSSAHDSTRREAFSPKYKPRLICDSEIDMRLVETKIDKAITPIIMTDEMAANPKLFFIFCGFRLKKLMTG